MLGRLAQLVEHLVYTALGPIHTKHELPMLNNKTRLSYIPLTIKPGIA